KCVDVFQRNGVGLLNLINDILDLSKVESGRIELDATEMDLRDVIARAMEVVEARARARALSRRQTIAPRVPVHSIGDPTRRRYGIGPYYLEATGRVDGRTHLGGESGWRGEYFFLHRGIPGPGESVREREETARACPGSTVGVGAFRAPDPAGG